MLPLRLREAMTASLPAHEGWSAAHPDARRENLLKLDRIVDSGCEGCRRSWRLVLRAAERQTEPLTATPRIASCWLCATPRWALVGEGWLPCMEEVTPP